MRVGLISDNWVNIQVRSQLTILNYSLVHSDGDILGFTHGYWIHLLQLPHCLCFKVWKSLKVISVLNTGKSMLSISLEVGSLVEHILCPLLISLQMGDKCLCQLLLGTVQRGNLWFQIARSSHIHGIVLWDPWIRDRMFLASGLSIRSFLLIVHMRSTKHSSNLIW